VKLEYEARNIQPYSQMLTLDHETTLHKIEETHKKAASIKAYLMAPGKHTLNKRL
jgi:hypothetical protein